MIVYLVATFLACALAWRGTKAGCRWPWFVAAAVPLVLVSALRWDVGTDFYFTYFPVYRAMECRDLGGSEELVNEIIGPLFERLRHGPIDSVPKLYRSLLHSLNRQEIGFRQLMAFMSWSGLGFRGLIAVTSLLIGACVFLAVYRQSRSPVLAIYLYVATSGYFLGLNIIRQYLAIGIFLVAVEFIVRRRPLCYLACITVAVLFHRSAVLLYPCYFLSRFAIRPWQGFLLVAAALLAAAEVQPIALWLLPKLGLTSYVTYFSPKELRSRCGFEFFFFAINMAFLLFGAWYWKRTKERSPYFAIWYGLTVIGTVFLAFSGCVPLMKRVNYYFAAPHFLLLPEILLAESGTKLRRILTALVVLGFALETFVAVWVFNKNEVLPYGISRRPDHSPPRVRFATRPFGWQLPD